MEEKFINKTTASRIQSIAVLMMIVHHTLVFLTKYLREFRLLEFKSREGKQKSS